jgi:chromosome partitioning protein
MAQTISVVSSKGGSGKTTTALNLGVALAERGRRTLLIDLDPQGAIGLSLDRSETEWPGLAEYLMEDAAWDSVLVQTKLATFSILPRGRLDPVDICEYELFLHSSQRVAELISQGAVDFDYILVDSPSGLGMITRAILAASDWALIPLQAEPLALRSLGQMLRVIDHVRREENTGLKLLGILPTMVELKENASLNVMGTVWSDFGGVLDTCIPRMPIFAKASEAGLPVSFLGGRTPPEVRRFELLGIEIEAKIADQVNGAGAHDEKPQREII